MQTSPYVLRIVQLWSFPVLLVCHTLQLKSCLHYFNYFVHLTASYHRAYINSNNSSDHSAQSTRKWKYVVVVDKNSQLTTLVLEKQRRTMSSTCLYRIPSKHLLKIRGGTRGTERAGGSVGRRKGGWGSSRGNVNTQNEGITCMLFRMFFISLQRTGEICVTQSHTDMEC